FRFEVIDPAHERREAHQDRLRSTAGLEPEDRASIIEEVEFHIAPAAIQLVLTVPLGKRFVAPLFRDRNVGIEKGIAYRGDESEILLAIPIDVVEEDAADPARLA